MCIWVMGIVWSRFLWDLYKQLQITEAGIKKHYLSFWLSLCDISDNYSICIDGLVTLIVKLWAKNIKNLLNAFFSLSL